MDAPDTFLESNGGQVSILLDEAVFEAFLRTLSQCEDGEKRLNLTVVRPRGLMRHGQSG